MAKILICDDSAFTRKMIKETLNVDGHTFLDVGDGEQLLEIMKKETFDLVLLDLRMPKKDGFEVLEDLKLRKNTTPIIIISSEKEEEVKDRLLSLGIAAFVSKPFEKNTLLEKIRSILLQ